MAAKDSDRPSAEHGADLGALLALYRRFARWLWFLVWTAAAGLFVWWAFDAEWKVVGDFLFDERIRRAAWVAVKLTIWGMLFGVILGLIFGVMRVANSAPANGLANVYIWLVRGTPFLLQLFLIFFALRDYIEPSWLSDHPFGNIPLLRDFNDVRFRAAVLALAVNEGAYMTEIVRAGIISVDSGQMEAGRSLGMTNMQGMRRIVLPQAVRVILPPTGNEVIAMVKNTSLVSTIGLFELLARSRSIYADNFQVLELLLVAAFWYLLITTILSLGQAWLEDHLTPRRRQQPARPLLDRLRLTMLRSRARP